ncbi:MAG: DeoR/GlpR family DNA-binding transcription regulator [Candidatus Acetothermia bacterium]
MLAKQRRRKIANIVREQGEATTSELSERFSVSEITIRKDLEKLAEQGLIERAHGGAVKRESTVSEPSYEEKASAHMEEKKKIGEKSATLIEEDSTILLGNGTTTMQMIPHLQGKDNLTVLTNSLNNAMEIFDLPDVKLSIIGGDARKKNYALVGPLAEECFDHIYVDQLFFGVDGISFEQGLTTPTLMEAKICEKMIEVSNEVILVADHSKFGRVVHGKIADMEVVDSMVTDANLEEDSLKFIKDLEIDYVQV